ncbi:hypothetical protein HHI36_013680 [Cryptolaemus montrouzieri]|uniref:Uncharacterized protein n=1 Tax=Cryptolaemus montrouzieri TaxID=559131 RepID=A0ABD2NIC1_9CUCU
MLLKSYRNKKPSEKLEAQKETKKSFAEITRTDHTLFIKPNNKNQSSGATKLEIKQLIRPADLKIAISKVLPINKGGVMIKCLYKDVRGLLRDETKQKLEDGYDVGTNLRK